MADERRDEQPRRISTGGAVRSRSGAAQKELCDARGKRAGESVDAYQTRRAVTGEEDSEVGIEN